MGYAKCFEELSVAYSTIGKIIWKEMQNARMSFLLMKHLR